MPEAARCLGMATEAEQWKRMEGRLEENRANTRKNGVTIEAAVAPEVRGALRARRCLEGR
jgi:hypothetical protein